MAANIRQPEYLADSIQKWISETAGNAGASGAILGLSGGIDSAVLAVLLKRALNSNMLSVIMPCRSNPVDEVHARLLADKFNIPVAKVDLTDIFVEHEKLILKTCAYSDMSRANTKARLRMTTLYSIGQSMGFLVCGTSNKAELTAGYFTKYGDSGSDMLPLGDLLKSEVRALAKFLGVPNEITDKPPSAGLWDGQTDEDEMGLTYDDLDRFISEGNGDSDVVLKIQTMNRISAHKRATPPICIIN